MKFATKVLKGFQKAANVVGDKAIEVGIDGLFKTGMLFYTVGNVRLHNAKEAATAIEKDGMLKLRGPGGWLWFNGATQKYEGMLANDIPPEYQKKHTAPVHAEPRPRRNAPCPCGSGRKWKRCCGQRE